jgi:hypothetical protein
LRERRPAARLIGLANRCALPSLHQDAFGFLLTTVLFTQHLWTLAIAISTFLLLVSTLIAPMTTATYGSSDITSPPALPAFSCDEVHGEILAHLVGGDLGGSLLTFRQ